MAITRVDVEKIAQLARLELTDEEAAQFTTQLGSILSYVEKLNELDTSGVAPMSQCVPAESNPEYTWRDDELRPPLGQERAVSGAPDSDGHYFKVPKVIGG